MSQIEILKYTCLIYGSLFFIGIAVALAARSPGWGRNMTQATISWFVIFLLFIGAAYLGPWAVAVLMLPIAILAMREYFQHAGVGGPDVLIPASVMVLVAAWAAATGRVKLFYCMPVVATIVLFW